MDKSKKNENHVIKKKTYEIDLYFTFRFWLRLEFYFSLLQIFAKASLRNKF